MRNIENNNICLVFIHGFCSGPDDWNKQIDYFQDNIHVIAPILRGHDGKNISDLPMSIEQLTNDCEKIIKQQESQFFIFVGHSMGTRVAINLCQRLKDQTLGLVLIDGSKISDIDTYGKTISNFENTIYYGSYKRELRKMFNEMFFDKQYDKHKKRIIKRAINIPSSFSLPLRRNLIWFDSHCLDKLLSGIHIPILVMQSTKLDKKGKRRPIKKDKNIFYIEYIQSLCDNVETKVFNNTGHYIPLEKPDLVNSAIFQWINKIKSSPK
tara:strand:- start:126 stop:926 length:801 start_codon:yes stop_codon:yes gene_type:complete